MTLVQSRRRPDVGQSGAEDPQRQKDGGGLDAEGTRQMEQMVIESYRFQCFII